MRSFLKGHTALDAASRYSDRAEGCVLSTSVLPCTWRAVTEVSISVVTSHNFALLAQASAKACAPTASLCPGVQVNTYRSAFHRYRFRPHTLTYLTDILKTVIVTY